MALLRYARWECDMCGAVSGLVPYVEGTEVAPEDWKHFGSAYGLREDTPLHLGDYMCWAGHACPTCLKAINDAAVGALEARKALRRT